MPGRKRLLSVVLLAFAGLVGCFGLPSPSQPGAKIEFSVFQAAVKKRDMKALPAVARGLVVSGDEFGNVTCRKISDGSLVWETDLEGYLAPHQAAIVENRVLLLDDHYSNFLGLDLETGSLTWKLPADNLGGPLTERWIDPPWLVAIRYTGTIDQPAAKSYAIDTRTGRFAWTHDGKVCLAEHGLTIIDRDKVWAIMETASGRELWTRAKTETADRVPVFDGRTIAFSTPAGNEIAFCDAMTGKENWSEKLPPMAIYLGRTALHDGTFYWFDKQEGEVVAQNRPVDRLWKTPLRMGDKKGDHAKFFFSGDKLVLVVGIQNTGTLLSCLERNSGRLLWQTLIQDSLVGMSHICNGGFYKNIFYAGRGRYSSIYGFDMNDGRPLWNSSIPVDSRIEKPAEDAWFFEDGAVLMTLDRKNLLKLAIP